MAQLDNVSVPDLSRVVRHRFSTLASTWYSLSPYQCRTCDGWLVNSSNPGLNLIPFITLSVPFILFYIEVLNPIVSLYFLNNNIL